MHSSFFLNKTTNGHNVYNFFGIKLSIKNGVESKASRIIQDTLDLSKIKTAARMIVFLTPPNCKMSGGVMSIFSLCSHSRTLDKGACCLISTYPGKSTYIINDEFKNCEKVYRFEQITQNALNVQELILHIPEYYAAKFYSKLNKNEIRFLKSIPTLQINIMNQNILLMPKPNEIKPLYNLTNNITQTVAHNKYATQETCNTWHIPTHLFAANFNLKEYSSTSFLQKEKIIVLSPDKNKHKDKIINLLKEKLPDWKFITVKNMTFAEFMDLVSRAYFSITFGEGMDGYFMMPFIVGSIGFSVYNNHFFPDSSWANLENVFKSYEEMYEKIVDKIKIFHKNQNLYEEISKLCKRKHDELYNTEKFQDNLARFYKKEYDFIPNEAKQ